MVNKCVSLKYKLSIVIPKKHLHSLCQSVELQKFQILEESIGLFCTEALLAWKCFVLPCTNLYLVKDVLVSLMMEKFRQVSQQYRQFTRFFFLSYSYSFSFRLYTENLPQKIILASGSDLVEYTEKTLNASVCIDGLEQIPLSCPELSLAFSYTWACKLREKKKWVVFLNCFIFFFPAWPEIEIYIWKIDFIPLEVAWAILSTM